MVETAVTHEAAVAKTRTPIQAVLEEAASLGSFALSVSGLRHHFNEVCSARLKDLGLTPSLLYFIIYIAGHDGCTQSQMNDALCVDVGYSTRSVAKLAQLGYVERRPNPADGRSSLLFLTAQGKQAYACGRQVMDEWNQAALCCLDDAEKKQLVELLGRVIMGLTATTRDDSAANEGN